MIKTQLIKGGGKNYSVLVKGKITEETSACVLDLSQIDPKVEDWKGIRLDSILWVIEEKVGIRLWWDEDKTDIAVPMESRNHLRFDEGITSPRVAEGWKKKIWMSTVNFEKDNPAKKEKYFMLVIDFDRQ